MLPEMSAHQERELANLVWIASQSFIVTPEQHLAPWIDRWPDEVTRPAVAAELLRCVAGSVSWDSAWLARRLAECVPYWNEPAPRLETIRGIFCDSVESGRASCWAKFVGLGDSPEELGLRFRHDPVGLGQVLDERYRLEERIGNGSFGVVFRAQDQQGRVVAVKLPYSSLETREKRAQLLRAESRLLADLRGTGIPRFIELLEIGGNCPALVMQILPGGSLFALARQGKLPAQRAAKIVCALATALDAAHARGLVHCDVKPENVLLDQQESPYITDFGLALDETARFDGGRSLGLTPAYASPEAIVGLKQQLDARSDVYALGTILYELLTGQRLVQGISREDAVVEQIVAGRHLLAFPDDTPAPLRAVCQRALRLDPNERHNTAAELAEAIRAALDENDSATGNHNAKRQLLTWRMGMKLGGAAERHAHYRHLLRNVPVEIDDTNLAVARQAFNTAVGNEVTAAIQTDELCAVAAEMGFVVEAFPQKEAVWSALMNQRTLKADQIHAIRAGEPEVSQYLDETYEAIAKSLRAGDPQTAHTFAFAVRVNLLEISAEARNTLADEARLSGLPATLWQAFANRAVTWSNEPDGQSLVNKLDKQVEQYLLRGHS